MAENREIFLLIIRGLAGSFQKFTAKKIGITFLIDLAIGQRHPILAQRPQSLDCHALWEFLSAVTEPQNLWIWPGLSQPCFECLLAYFHMKSKKIRVCESEVYPTRCIMVLN